MAEVVLMAVMCWHRWDKWKVTGEGVFMVEYDVFTGFKLAPSEKFVSGCFIKQQRECEKCGKIQLRRARA